MKKLILALGLLFLCSNAWARTATWDGGDAGALASTAANWDLDTAPVAGDAVVFDGTSSDNCTFDLTADFASINTTGYGGVVTASVTTRFSGNITFANSTWAHGNQKIIFDATMTVDPGTAGNTLYDVDFVFNPPTITLTNDLYITHELLVDNGYDVTWNGADLHIQGDVQSTNPTSFYNFPNGTSDIYIDGSGAQLINFNTPGTGTRAIGNLVVFNKSGGTATMKSTYNNDMHFTSGMIFTAGTVDWTTNSVVPKFVGSQSINLNSMTMPSVTNSSGTLTLTGNLNYGSITISGTFAPSSYTWSGSGNITKTGTLTAGTSTATFSGSTTHTIDGTGTFYNLTCPTGETCSFDDADIFTISGTGAGDGTWQSDDATNTVDIDFTAETISSGAGTRVDSAGGVAVITSGTITGCVNWANYPTSAYTWVA